MKFILTLILLICSQLSIGQLELVTPLHNTINESSGLIYLNGKLITHTDSGGDPILYEIDSTSGDVNRSVVIDNATNVDWEDICFDSTYIYVADFGNNNGSRTDLSVYRISISDYLTTPNDTVTAETIHFSYADQIDFNPGAFSTNYDAETIISYHDTLIIFTKNWGNSWTNVYALPKSPGTYQLDLIDSLNIQGLAGGGTYNSISNKIVLAGYTSSSFIAEIDNFNIHDLTNATMNRYDVSVPSGYSIQTESITHTQGNQYYLTAENNFTGPSALYKLNSSSANSKTLTFSQPKIYPNPTTDIISLNDLDFEVVEIYSINGKLIKKAYYSPFSISDLRKGVYLLVAKDSSGQIIISEKILIQ